jgi:hypothetical protein
MMVGYDLPHLQDELLMIFQISPITSVMRRSENPSSQFVVLWLRILQGDEENDRMLDALREAASTGAIDPKKSGKKQIQSKMLLEMLAIDRQRALTTMKAWAEFVELASGRRHHTHFATLDEYIPYRVIDVGQMYWCYDNLWVYSR